LKGWKGVADSSGKLAGHPHSTFAIGGRHAFHARHLLRLSLHLVLGNFFEAHLVPGGINECPRNNQHQQKGSPPHSIAQ